MKAKNRNPRARRPPELDYKMLQRLAWFRYQLRRFLRFSEQAARAEGVTPQQYQLLLGISGYTSRTWATISELAEFLQERHNAVVGLVERAMKRRLVRKVQGTPDRRFIRVHLTPRGEAVLARLAERHHEEVSHLASRMLTASRVRARVIRPVKGA